MKNIKINKIIFYTFLVLYLEFVYKIAVYNNIGGINFIYTLLFSIPIILVLTLFSSFFKSKINRIITFSFTTIFCIYFIFQYIFYILFSVPFSFQTIGLANQALDFANIVIETLLKNIVMLVLFFIPLVGLIICRKKIEFKEFHWKKNLLCLGLILVFYVISILSLQFDKGKLYSTYNIYYHVKEEKMTILDFGLVTATRLDIKRTLFGFEETILVGSDNEEKVESDIEEPIIITYNEVEIDFDSLIANTGSDSKKKLLEYLKTTSPTNKNEYTGYFEGKNLIFILAESFNSIAVDPKLTPTLYKLVNSGFVFNNFYSPEFLSTTGGEFQAATGLIPTQSILNSWKSKSPNIYYAFGNSFNRLGYTTNAYHNWTYTYYQRNKTMKTLGFNSYMGCGNGLQKEMNCKWLPSDVDMINVTLPKYNTSEKFMTYYVSVSGHSPYNFRGGNSIANKNRKLVNDLPYSAPVKAYLSAQIEFDRALETLINKLEADGILDDTVIAFAGDHYPYVLTMDEVNEISKFERDDVVEVNRSNLVIWNSGMTENVVVDKTASQIDILPTLLNLFGVEYDSRLLVGKDILSDYEGIAVFSDRSWVTDKGTYFTHGKKFISKDGSEVDNEYISRINTRVANSFSISDSIIKNNIYNEIFK